MVPRRRPGLLHRPAFLWRLKHLPRVLGRLGPQALRPRHQLRHRPIAGSVSRPCRSPVPNPRREVRKRKPGIGRYAACRGIRGPLHGRERYTLTMGTPAAPIAPRQVGILILDDDVQSQGALKQILDSEGWRVRVVPDTKLFLAELRTGEWSLVIVNVTITGTDSPLFFTL